MEGKKIVGVDGVNEEMEMLIENTISPRIKSLIRSIMNNENEALESFWLEVKKNYSPIVEEIEDDTENVLITFVYRADEPIENVVIFGGTAGYDNYLENQMERLLETNVWYKTYKVRNDLRFSYSLSVNDLLNDDWGKRNEGIMNDPLGKQIIICDYDDLYPDQEPFVKSVVELSNAVRTWSCEKEGVPKGKLEKFTLKSDILGYERRIWVYTPVGYTENGKPNGMLLLNDGFEYVTDLSATTTLDNLIHENKIPPLVTVFVASTEKRNEELACNDDFVSCISEEIVPWVKSKYNVTDSPKENIIGGLSAGGLAASYIGFTHSEIFGNVLSQSGSYWWAPNRPEEKEWLSSQFEEAEKLPLKFYLNVGVLESDKMMIKTNENLRDILKSKKYEVIYNQFPGGHDYLWWDETLAEGLISLIGSENHDKMKPSK